MYCIQVISRVSKENSELKLPTCIPNDAISPRNTCSGVETGFCEHGTDTRAIGTARELLYELERGASATLALVHNFYSLTLLYLEISIVAQISRRN